jgi:hypothetical protein
MKKSIAPKIAKKIVDGKLPKAKNLDLLLKDENLIVNSDSNQVRNDFESFEAVPVQAKNVELDSIDGLKLAQADAATKSGSTGQSVVVAANSSSITVIPLQNLVLGGLALGGIAAAASGGSDSTPSSTTPLIPLSSASGSAAQILASINSPGLAAGATVTLTGTSISDVQLTSIASAVNAVSGSINASSINSLNGSLANSLTLLQDSAISGLAPQTIVLSDTTPDVGDLVTLLGLTGGVIDGSTITTLVGSSGDVTTVLGANSVSLFSVTGSFIGLDDVNVTLTDTSAFATDLIAIDLSTTGVINSSAVQLITGDYADVSAINPTNITAITTADITLTDSSVGVTDLNTVDAITSGVVTAIVTEGDVATLKTLSGTGNAYTITVTDTTNVDPADLNIIDGATTVLVDATAVISLSGLVDDVLLINSSGVDISSSVAVTLNDSLVSVADLNLVNLLTSGVITATVQEEDVVTLLTLTGTGNNYDIAISDVIVSAEDLLTIDGITTHTVDITAVTTLTGLTSDVLTAISNFANFTGTASLTTIELSDASAAATDLNNLDSATSITIDATNVISITGSSASITTVFGGGFSGLGAQNLALSDTTITAIDINALDALTTGVIDASVVGQWSGSIADANTALASLEITGIDNADLTLTDTTATTTNLLSLEADVGGTINTASVLTITGSIAEASSLLINSIGISNLDSVDIVLTDTTAAATALTSLVALTSGEIDATSVDEISGTLAEASAALTNADIQNLETADVTLSDAELAAADLNTLNGLTSGVIDASSVTTLTGSSTDVSTTLTANVALTITGLGAVDVILDNTTITATVINALDALTTGLIDIPNVTLITGLSADVLLIDDTQLSSPLTANVSLSDLSVSVADLNDIDSHTTGAITATVDENDVASLLTLTGTGNAYTISVTDSSVLASDLNIIATKTINTVSATTVVTLTGAIVDVTNAFNNADLILSNQAVTLSDTTLAAADLNNLNSLTGGVINASSVTTLTGSSTDVSTTLTANATITGLGAVAVTLDDITITATVINALDALTTGVIDASVVGQWSGSIADANTALASLEITGIDNADLTLTDTTATTTNLLSLEADVGGTINTASVLTITGLIAEASSLLINSIGISNLDSVDIVLTDTTAAATALTSLVALTSGEIDATSVDEISGTLAEASAALTNADIQNLETADVTLSDVELAAADLNTLNGLTSGVIDASSVTTLTGSSTDVSTTLTANATITGLGAVAVTLDDITITATVINALDALTTGVIDASVVGQWSGSIADANTALASLEITGIDNADLTLTDTTATTTNLLSLEADVGGTINTASVLTITGSIAEASSLLINSIGISNLDSVDIVLTDTTAAATALTSLVALTSGEIDATSVDEISGTLAEASAALTNADIQNLETADVTLSDAELAAADLNTLNGLTSGVIDASSVTTLTGSSTDVSTTLTANATITGLGAVAVTLDDITITATVINALDALTTGVIDASVVGQWSGSIADANTALASLEITGIDNADLTLTDTTATTTNLLSLEADVGGTINTASVLTITGSIAEASSLLINSIGISNLDSVDIVLTDTTAAATALTSLVALTSGEIDATSVDEISGTLAEASAALTNADIQNLETADVTLSGTSASASALNALDQLTTGTVDATTITTLTGGLADVTTVLNATVTILNLTNPSVTLSDTSVTASGLNTLDGLTSGIINASTVNSITGTSIDVLAINPANITGLGAADITLSDNSVAVSDVVTIDASTTGIVTAIVDETDVANLLFLTGTGNALTITIDDLTVDPADLNLIANKTTVQVDATTTTLISGSVADVLNIDTTLVDLSPSVNVTLTDPSVSISNLNTIDASTTGVVTATVTETTVSDLLTLTGTVNAYEISVVGSNVNALDLTAIDAKTTENLDAAGVVKISGLAADITSVMQATTITGTTNANLALTDPTITIAVLDAVILLTGGTIDVTSVGTLSGASAAIATAFTNSDLIGQGAINLTLTDTSSTAVNLNSLNAATSGVVNAATVSTLSGALSDVSTALTSSRLTGLGSVAVTLSDPSAASADLNALDALTSGSINASSVGTITGSISNVSTALKSNGISGLSSKNVTLDNTSAIASELVSLDSLNSGTIDASSIASMTGTILQATNVFGSVGITGLASTLTVSDVTSTATALNALDASVTGTIDANSLTTLTGSLENILTALISNSISGIGDVNVSLTNPQVDILDINSVNTATTGLVSSTALKTIAASTDSSLTASGISLTAINKIALFNNVDATFESSTLNGKTIAVLGAGNNGGETLTVNGSSVGETINLGGLTIDTDDITVVNINGLAGNDVITGSSGADKIDGGDGVDTLTGGVGNDTFVLAGSALGSNAALVATFGDTVTDFQDGNSVIAQDVLQFNASSLAAISGFISNASGITGTSGAQGASFLVSGAGSQSANAAFAQLLFNTTTGALMIDADGTGSGAAVLIANITPGSTLTATDFQFV